MKILVLGGTVFLGRHIAQAALDQGHVLALFNRGRHHPELFRDVERLVGDRDGDISALQGRRFDAVIDCSGYTPQQLERTARALGGDVPHYTFVSTVSVYAAFPPGVAYDEHAAVASGDQGYGPLKAAAEVVIEAALPSRVAVVRPGLIVGPHDPTGRFTYWPQRMARAGEVLAPGRPQRPVQFIDVRDLALWCLHLAQHRVPGVFNAIGPSPTMAELLEACRATTRSDARCVWLGDDVLATEAIEPWTELPLWIPERDAAFGGMLLADNRRAVAAGLVSRPMHETVQDTWAWARVATADATIVSPGLSQQREALCLARHAPV